LNRTKASIISMSDKYYYLRVILLEIQDRMTEDYEDHLIQMYFYVTLAGHVNIVI